MDERHFAPCQNFGGCGDTTVGVTTIDILEPTCRPGAGHLRQSSCETTRLKKPGLPPPTRLAVAPVQRSASPAMEQNILSTPELSPLEQEVLEEYERLAGNMKQVCGSAVFACLSRPLPPGPSVSRRQPRMEERKGGGRRS